MNDHPDAVILDRLALRPQSIAEGEAIEAGAAAIRALAQFRPHHPAVVVSSVYAVFHVPFDAVLKAREALGDFDLGRFDMAAAQAAVQRDREDHFDEMGRDAVREKWGR
jgi:hypothetical protein